MGLEHIKPENLHIDSWRLIADGTTFTSTFKRGRVSCQSEGFYDYAVKPKPNKKWYSVSIEGLIKAAENLDKLGTPVISLSRKVLSLLGGG